MLADWAFPWASPCSPRPEKEPSNVSHAQERLRVTEACGGQDFDRKGWSNSQGVLAETDNDKKIGPY